MPKASARPKIYTEDDHDKLPVDIRTELIDEQFYDISVPRRIHQEISMFLSNKIANLIDPKNAPCKVYNCFTGASDWIVGFQRTGLVDTS